MDSLTSYAGYKRGDTIPQSCISVDAELRQLSDDLEDALQLYGEEKLADEKVNSSNGQETIEEGVMTENELWEREDVSTKYNCSQIFSHLMRFLSDLIELHITFTCECRACSLVSTNTTLKAQQNYGILPLL